MNRPCGFPTRDERACGVGIFSTERNRMEREKILQAAAEAVAREWQADEVRAGHFGIKPSSVRMWITGRIF
jgi:hypothetical protein